MEQQKQKVVTILAISDTHNQLSIEEAKAFKNADILIHAGDFTQDCSQQQFEQFREVLKSIQGIQKVVIPGNHEHIFNKDIKHNEHTEEEIEEERQQLKKLSYFVQFQLIEVKGVRILAMAESEEFFCRNFDFFPHLGKQIIDKYQGRVDVLVTHYPPYGILDRINLKNKGGSKGLLHFVKSIKPKIHIFGHIHQDYGQTEVQGIKFYNAAYLDRCYKQKNKPFYIDLPLRDVKKEEK